MTEKQFQAQVRQLARLTGWMCYAAYDSRRSPAGYPDLTLVRLRPGERGRLVFAELKVRAPVTPAQQSWLAALAAVPGVEAYLWRPGDWKEIEAVLR